METEALCQSHTALYAFSADPITYGHINIVERAARCFPHLIVGIGRNPAKNYLFTLEERLHMAEAALSHIPNVEVRSFEGMVVDFAFEQGACVIVKGVRTAADMEYEQTLHQVGVSQDLSIDTHLLFADPKLAHVSSSVVKAMQLEHGFIQGYVPPVVKAALEARLSNQLVLGVTGDIAAGKSTLTDALVAAGTQRGLSVHNIDMDKLAHQVLAGQDIGEPLYRDLTRSLTERFGDDIVVDGRISRPALAAHVFDDDEARHFLNQLIAKPMAVQLRKALQNKAGLILLNGALLPDMGILGLCNYRCILCEVDPAEQRARLIGRGLNETQIESRLAAQCSGAEKAELICSAIDKHHFGQLWRYDPKAQSPEGLLERILSDCEYSQ